MKRMSLFSCCLILTSGIFLASVLTVDAGKLSQKELPETVKSAFQKSYPKAIIKSCSKEERNGKTVYEIESQDGKLRRDIIYSTDGIALEIEERIPPANLPDTVKRTIEKAYPKGKIKIAEKLTKGRTVEYEVVIRSGKNAFEVVLDTEGNILKTQKP
jgi:uncharacterized membrane protein YkoI